jgi:hypothetical protein
MNSLFRIMALALAVSTAVHAEEHRQDESLREPTSGPKATMCATRRITTARNMAATI